MIHINTLIQTWRENITLTELIKKLWSELANDHVLGTSAQLSYYFIFALFPFLIFLITLLGYLPISPDEMLNLFGQTIPDSVFEFIKKNLQLIEQARQGKLLYFGIITALWATSTGMTSLIRALNQAYKVKDTRSFWKIRGIAILFTLGLSLFILIALILLVFGHQLGLWLAFFFRLGLFFIVLWDTLRWLSIISLLTFAFACLYYFSPNSKVNWQSILPGSVFAVGGWIIISLGFSYYVNHFGSYEAVYGSLGAVIVLMTWLFFSAFIILSGGELNAVIGGIKKRD